MGEALEGGDGTGFGFTLFGFAELQGVEGAGEAFPAFGATTLGFAQVARAGVFVQTHGGDALDQKRSAQLGTFGDEQPAQSVGQARLVDGAGNRSGDFGVQVGQVQAGLIGAAALRQVGEYLAQLGVLVQGCLLYTSPSPRD